MNDWKQMMKRLKLESILEKSPGFFAASGGYTMAVKPYTDKTANGLTRCIIDFLTFKGHYANRISTQGQARVNDIKRYSIFTRQLETVATKVQWTKSSTRKGTPDIEAIINGQAVKIEVKVGKDTMKDDQKKEQVKIENAGGRYYVTTDMPSFLQWFETEFNMTHSKLSDMKVRFCEVSHSQSKIN